MVKELHIANSLGEFIQKIAINYVRYGYTRYAARKIPEPKDLKNVDTAIFRCYQVTANRNLRARQRACGLASIAYVRWEHTFILLATKGRHREIEKRTFFNIEERPFHIRDYSISLKQGKPYVSLTPRRFDSLRKHANRIALHNQRKVIHFFETLSPFQYPGIVSQKRTLLRRVNKKRKRAGLPLIWVELAPGWRNNRNR